MGKAVDMQTRKSIDGYATDAELDALAESVQAMLDALTDRK